MRVNEPRPVWTSLPITHNTTKEGHDDEELEDDQEVERDGTDP
jgi:hypothetical protein